MTDWQAHGEFVPGSDEDGGGRWMLRLCRHFDQPVPRDGWPLAWRDVNFTAQCTPFRHLGFFPDMAPVWDWMRGKLDDKADASTLNLFGYTGVGTLALSACGPVTHVDASKKSVAQARENAALSGMAERPIRWLVDDAAKFTAREVRREKRYDGIILDPPKFGRGPDGEVWRLEEGLPGLIADCRRLLDAESQLPVPHCLCSADVIAGDCRAARRASGRSARHHRAWRSGGAGGRAGRTPAANRDIRALVCGGLNATKRGPQSRTPSLVSATLRVRPRRRRSW